MPEVKVLIVDDDELIVKSFQEILTLEGYAVDTAGTVKDALAKFKKTTYDLALLDIKLPDREGTELLKEAHQMKPETIKIMVTGFADVDNAVKSLNEGASAFVMKPVNPDALLATITKKLEEKKKREFLNEDSVSEWIENRLNTLDE